MRRSQSIKDNLTPDHTACCLLFERLNERDRRHVAGLLALAIGHDGVTLVGDLFGLTRDTVAKDCRPWMWKKMLQEFAEETGLTITVRHYPRGASKWNPIEHRLFAMISKSWSGYPLRSLSILLARIRGTTTETGLSVTARWNRRRYRTKEKVTKEEQKALRVRRHNVIQRWNYTIAPKRRNN